MQTKPSQAKPSQTKQKHKISEKRANACQNKYIQNYAH